MFIWSTRGRAWGYRFLRTGGSSDPLVERDRAFDGSDPEAEVFHRRGSTLALRFIDPEDRKDAAGRPIFHEVVIVGPESSGPKSLEEGIAAYWPALAAEYTRVWDLPKPPDTRD